MGKLHHIKDGTATIYPVTVAPGVAYINTTSGLTATTAQAAIDEVVTKVAEKVVAVEELSAPTTGFAKTYDVKQNGVSVGKIDIPECAITCEATSDTTEYTDYL